MKPEEILEQIQFDQTKDLIILESLLNGPPYLPVEYKPIQYFIDKYGAYLSEDQIAKLKTIK